MTLAAVSDSKLAVCDLHQTCDQDCDGNWVLASMFSLPAGGILQQSWQENLLELETQLARSTAQWKLVIGHHPVRRNNRPNNNMDLLPTLEPMLEKYGVQAYFCGHEHNLQYLHQQDSSVHYVVSGGGSLTDYAPIVHFDNGGSRFQYWGSGEVMPDSKANHCASNAFRPFKQCAVLPDVGPYHLCKISFSECCCLHCNISTC